MNTNSSAAQSTSTTSRRSLRRVLSATIAGASVAVVGVGALSPAEAQAAGVASGIRYVAPAAQTYSSVSPTSLTTSSARSLRFKVTAGNTLVNA